MKSTFCIVEDRPGWDSSLKLLVLSLVAYKADREINLFYPPAGRDFVRWADGLPGVCVRTQRLKASGWDVKPEAALALMGEGFEEVIWIDSDIIVLRDPARHFSSLDERTLVVTIDTPAAQRNGTAASRARKWGFEVRRDLPHNLNTGVHRVTGAHRRLLERWSELISCEDYQRCQQMQWYDRSFHLMGDHDPLMALLCSAEFSDVAVQFIRRDKDIVHFDGVWGYTVAARLRHMIWGPPTFVHSMCAKPWSYPWETARPGLRDWFKDRYLDLSPYMLYAARLGRDVGYSPPWVNSHYALSGFFRALTMGSPPLAGLPLAALWDAARALRSLCPWCFQLKKDIPRHAEGGRQ